MPSLSSPHSPSTFIDEHAAWHADVEAQRSAPHGPLSTTALHWLGAEPQHLPGLPGAWRSEADGAVIVALAENDGVAFEGADAVGHVRIGPITGTDSVFLDWGEKRIELAARGGRIALRPRDPASPDRVAYAGTATFPADPAWAIEARFIPAPHDGIEVGSAAEGHTNRFDSPGRAEFEVDGRALSLTLFGGADDTRFRVIFADETGTDLTYPAARYTTAVRTGDDTLVIDFNRTTNPVCAYSDSATCPFPPPENRLPVRIEAGELRPGASL